MTTLNKEQQVALQLMDELLCDDTIQNWLQRIDHTLAQFVYLMTQDKNQEHIQMFTSSLNTLGRLHDHFSNAKEMLQELE